MSTEPFSSSELIYLFLDGEHNGVERSMLFKALAQDQDLQHEFEDALLLRNAALRESAEVIPSATLSRSLMTQAGFGAAGVAVAEGVSNSWFQGLFSHWTNVALLCLLPVLGAAGGYFVHRGPSVDAGSGIASVATTGSYSPTPSNRQEPVAQTMANTSANDEPYASLRATVAEDQKLLSALSRQLSATQQSIELLRRTRRDTELQRVDRTALNTDQKNTIRLPLHSTDNAITAQQLSHTSSPLQTSGVGAEASDANSQIRLSTLQTTPVSAPSIVTVDHYVLPNSEFVVKSEALSSATPAAHSPWSAELRGTRSLSQTLGSLVDGANVSSILNFAASVSYDLNDHWSLYGSGGRESFVTYVSQVQNGFTSSGPQQWLTWGEVGARLKSSQLFETIPLYGFLQFGLGVTGQGGIGHVMPGLEWKPDRAVSFIAGIEQGALYSSRSSLGYKTAVTYGVRLNF